MSSSAFGPVLATLAILVVPAAFSAEAGSASARAERVMRSYVTACLSHDETTLRAVTTPDVLIESGSQGEGAAFTLNQAALVANCASVPRCWPLTLSNLTVASAGEDNKFVARYDLIAASLPMPWRHESVLVEMRGDRIARIADIDEAPALTRNSAAKE